MWGLDKISKLIDLGEDDEFEDEEFDEIEDEEESTDIETAATRIAPVAAATQKPSYYHPEDTCMATGLLERLKGDLAAYRPIPFWSWNDALKPERLRRQIDDCDHELLATLARRMSVSREIGRFKKAHNMRVVQPQRYQAVIDNRLDEGERLSLDREFIKRIMQAIHEESVRQQID